MILLRQLLSHMVRKGEITVVDTDGRRHTFGTGLPTVCIRLHDKAVARRLFWSPGLALGEGYMDGRLSFEGCSVYDILGFCYRNMGWRYGHWLQDLLAGFRCLTRSIAQRNPVHRSTANVAHHYDLSEQLYDLFLDNDQQYSCAYYNSPHDRLELAQDQKKRHLTAKLLIEPGMKVLDIGSGWGGLGLYLARVTGADVTGITLSKEQLRVSNQRAAAVGLADRVRFRLCDYREAAGRYDRIVSVGMFEHVGVGHYQRFFNSVRDLLTPDGIALLHSIGRSDGPGSTHPWLAKYIFPGGYSPALSEVIPHVEQSGLHTTDIEILRLHYAETLKEWRRRFKVNRVKIAELYDERFCRMWEFYLAASEAAFRWGGQIVFQLQMAKRVDTVPLTRDYMIDWERRQGIKDGAAVAAE